MKLVSESQTGARGFSWSWGFFVQSGFFLCTLCCFQRLFVPSPPLHSAAIALVVKCKGQPASIHKYTHTRNQSLVLEHIKTTLDSMCNCAAITQDVLWHVTHSCIINERQCAARPVLSLFHFLHILLHWTRHVSRTKQVFFPSKRT